MIANVFAVWLLQPENNQFISKHLDKMNKKNDIEQFENKMWSLPLPNFKSFSPKSSLNCKFLASVKENQNLES